MKFINYLFIFLLLSHDINSWIIISNKWELGGKEFLLGLGALLTGFLGYMFLGSEEPEFEYSEFIS